MHLDFPSFMSLMGRYKKAELKSFLQFHREGEEPLRDDEVRPRVLITAEAGLISDCHSQWGSLAKR